ncbi:hypothetical protein XENOCAPTIV_031013 [Xenoophorus captivus]|uniref:Uncharacterized protein n=1 Tax=Xenoophorus captivus TaxID=1517983 RepID=A0ABV0RCP8_9TELE
MIQTYNNKTCGGQPMSTQLRIRNCMAVRCSVNMKTCPGFTRLNNLHKALLLSSQLNLAVAEKYYFHILKRSHGVCSKWITYRDHNTPPFLFLNEKLNSHTRLWKK